MTSQRITLAVAAVMLSLVLSGSAQANPLLSGYGGPGEGSQVVLGAALVGGPPSSGGRSEGPSGTPGGPGAAAVGSAGAGGSSTSGSVPRGRGSRRSSRSGSADRSSTVSRARGISRPLASGNARDAYGSSVANPKFGVSEGGLLIMLLALLGIAVTGLVTRRFVRLRAASAGVVAKGVSGTARPRS